MKTYQRIASSLQAIKNCARLGDPEWANRHRTALEKLMCKHGPSGGGFDSGTIIDIEASTPNRLVLETAFHHMNDAGCYDGWTYHTVVVGPSLAFGFNLKVTGEDRNDIKDYIGQTFNNWLLSEEPKLELTVESKVEVKA